MFDPPGGLFPDDFNYGLPFIRGINLRFIELFVYVALLKAVNKSGKFQSVYIKSFQLLFLLTVTLLAYSLLLKTSVLSVIIAIKWIFIWSLLYSVPKLLDKYEEWLFFFRMVFIIVFIAFFSQILHLALGYPPSFLLGTDFNSIMGNDNRTIVLSVIGVTNTYDILAVRPISSSYIVLIGLSGSLFFQQYKINNFSRTYLSFVIFVSFISIFLTATRGWFIAFSFAIFLYLVLFQRTRRTLLAGFRLLFVITILLSIPFIQRQIVGSFKRISTLETVAQGDLSAGGTSSRVEYNMQLINLWKEKPVLGWGFSEFYKENGNGHAGLANLLFNVGILGFIVFVYFWFKLFFVPISVNRRISFSNPFKDSLFAFTLTFLIFFIINATSGQQFGIYLSFGGGIYAQIIFYSYSSFFISMAMNKEVQIKTIGL